MNIHNPQEYQAAVQAPSPPGGLLISTGEDLSNYNPCPPSLATRPTPAGPGTPAQPTTGGAPQTNSGNPKSQVGDSLRPNPGLAEALLSTKAFLTSGEHWWTCVVTSELLKHRPGIAEPVQLHKLCACLSLKA